MDGIRRRGTVALWTVLVAASALLPAVSSTLRPSAPRPPDGCVEWGRDPDGNTWCAHGDPPPPGVDPSEPLTTAEAIERGDEAEETASEAGDGGAEAGDGGAEAGDGGAEAGDGGAEAGDGASAEDFGCYGDGTDGYRVQAMYVVASDRPNRSAALSESFAGFAKITEGVFRHSAAKTGGFRGIRFVTNPDCTLKVLNVTIGATDDDTFAKVRTALQNRGYTSTSRKYLIWLDATHPSYCGVADLYYDEQAGEANRNNRGPQYGVTYSSCWGMAGWNTEAHELVHNLGGVQHSAPYATPYGHCKDEYDRLCYNDGGGAMVYVCTDADHETLLDCNDDTYFSTDPVPGSWLATHWNTADARFLESERRPSVSVTVPDSAELGEAVAVSGEATPPDGRTVDALGWSASDAGCVFADSSASDTTMTCAPGSAGSVAVTLTATDSEGFDASASASITVTGWDADLTIAASDDLVDPGTAVTFTGTISSSGVPIAGAAVALQRSTNGTSWNTVTSGVSDGAGGVSLDHTPNLSADYRFRFAADGTYETTVSPSASVAMNLPAPSLQVTRAPTSAIGYAKKATFSVLATVGGVNVHGETGLVYARTVGTDAWRLRGRVSVVRGRATFTLSSLTASTEVRFSLPESSSHLAGSVDSAVEVAPRLLLKVKGRAPSRYLEATVLPAHAGHELSIERNDGSGWGEVATHTLTRSTTFRLSIPDGSARTSLRLVLAAHDDHAEGRSSGARIR